MATVKLNAGGKVLTKGGKVSCGCCFACGLYSSFDFYDGHLSFDDYPNEISVEFSLQGFTSSGICTKIPLLNHILYQGNFTGDSVGVQSFDNRSAFGPEIEQIESWTLIVPGQQLAAPSTLSSDYITNKPTFASLTKIRDTFANSYAVFGPISGVVTRTNLSQVVFDGTYNNSYFKLTNYCGEYLGTNLRLIFNRRIHKWTVNGNAKIGFQNTPVGSYEGGYSVS